MLKEIRIKKGLSQSKLASISGNNIRTIQHYEQGSKDINSAGLENLLNLANALQVGVSEILTDKDLIEKYNSNALLLTKKLEKM